MDRLYDIKETARYLNIGVSTLRLWLRQGKIPRTTYFKVGNTYRFDLDAMYSHFFSGAPVPEQLELPFDNEE